jgi:hypothetical protein
MEEDTRKITRGERNNNPLNIKYSEKNRWVGKKYSNKNDPVFEEFKTMAYGLRAAIKLISNYCMRENGSTPAAIIRRWAPSNADGNHTENYIDYVENRMQQLLVTVWKHALSYDPKIRISYKDYDVMHALITAMSEFESRYTPLDFDFKAAWIMIYGRGV